MGRTYVISPNGPTDTGWRFARWTKAYEWQYCLLVLLRDEVVATSGTFEVTTSVSFHPKYDEISL